MNLNFEQIFKEFFSEELKTLSDNYDYIIFTTRRCFVLFKIALRKFKKETEKYKEKCFSSKAINIFADDFEDKRVLLIDDALLHGKALYILKNEIENYKPSKVDVHVIFQQYDKYDVANGLLKINAISHNLLLPEECKQISENIVKFFKKTGEAYIAYIGSLALKINQNIKDHINAIYNYLEKKYCRIDFNNNSFFFQKENELNSIFSFNVLRMYKHEKDNKVTIIPYSQLKPMSDSQLNAVFNRIRSALNNSNLDGIKTSIDKTRAVTAILSYFSWINVLNNLEKEFDIEIDKEDFDYLDYSYFKSFSNTFKNFDKTTDLLEKINRDFFKEITNIVLENDTNPYYSILKNDFKWYKKTIEILNPSNGDFYDNLFSLTKNALEQYIQYVSDFEEREFCKYVELNRNNPNVNNFLSFNYHGISVDVLINYFTDFVLNKVKSVFPEISSNQIDKIKVKNIVTTVIIDESDEGYISIDINAAHNGVVYSKIRTGERSWILIFNNNQEVFMALLQAIKYDKLLFRNETSIEKRKDYYDLIINNIISYSKEKNIIISKDYLISLTEMISEGIPYDLSVYPKYPFEFKDEKTANTAAAIYNLVNSTARLYIEE